MEKKELLEQLEQIKTGLETTLTEKANTEIAAKVEEKMKAVTTAIEEVKNAKPEVTADELAKVKSDLDVTIKALDILQVRMKSTKAPSQEVKSLDVVLKEAMEENFDNIAKFERKEIKEFGIDIKAAADMGTGNVAGTRYGAIMQPGIIEPQKRKVHIRSLMPGGNIGQGLTYTFMREKTNPTANQGEIAAVSENATKPQFDLQLEESTVKIETLAGWLRVSNKALNNIPGFIAYLQSRLPEKLMRVEDSQILYGNGQTPNLKGILTAGNYVSNISSATVLAEQIIDAMSLLEDTYERDTTAVLLRPKEYYKFFKNKAAGSGEYDLPDNFVFSGGTLYVSGVPVFMSTAVYKEDFVVGDFAHGAQFLTQEGMRLEFFREDGTNVRENKVTIRIEETVTLPVYGSDYFVLGKVYGES